MLKTVSIRATRRVAFGRIEEDSHKVIVYTTTTLRKTGTLELKRPNVSGVAQSARRVAVRKICRSPADC
jgi:hypothetical protein